MFTADATRWWDEGEWPAAPPASMHVAQSIVPGGGHRQPSLGGSASNDGGA